MAHAAKAKAQLGYTETAKDADQAIADATEESIEQDLPMPRGPRGPYGKRKYLRPALVRIFSMKPEARAAYNPGNGFEEAAMAMLNTALLPKGQYVCAVWREIRETLGEKIGSNWKKTMDELEDAPDVIMDLPTAKRTQ